tara:strand:+ start:13405 stop:13557 length:153 start_codon:yes stop_codon:yes gene_type:complete
MLDLPFFIALISLMVVIYFVIQIIQMIVTNIANTAVLTAQKASNTIVKSV